MSMNNDEIIELEQLLLEDKIETLKESLYIFNQKTNPNYEFIYNAINKQKYNDKDELINGFSGVILEGSSRSGKTWSWIFIIIYLALIKHKDEPIKITVYREFFADFKKTLHDDFKRVLDLFNLPNRFYNAEIVKSFRIDKTEINLLGCDRLAGSSHGSSSDYVIYNEMMFIPRIIFDQSEMRCRKFWIGDYNPSFTDHYVFDNVIPRPDIGFLRTTFKQNPFISAKEKNKILSYEPWASSTYDVVDDDILYNGKPISKSNQPPPHPINIENGTADEFNWKVYALGLRGAMKGVIIDHLTWIESFPDIAYTYANDFGFTADPNAFVKYAEDENNIWFELLIYNPVETPEDLSTIYETLEVEKYLPITCDSSDKYTGENKGTVEMVKGLKQLGYKASKVKKSKSVMFWILSMKKKRIHCVKNHLWKYVKKEKENYKFKEVNGILINQPNDSFNHIWDAVRYGHISYNKKEYDIKY